MSGTYETLIKLWRLVSGDEVNNPSGREIYWKGAAKLGTPLANARGDEIVVPVLVNHDDDRPIGIVRSLFNFDDTDGEWLCAACEITDPPSWLKRGTPASISTVITQRSPENRVLRTYVPEVSVLAPGVAPAEPKARVMVYRQSKAKPRATAPSRDDFVDTYAIEQARRWQAEAPEGVIRRPGVGRVLRVH